ncbi:MAG TPA: hypothetical protein VMF61_05050 [Candidatus Acidoferrales bacterium]|nr:hypothetical protein [Candidatus Acidoferrales bacterium]
MRLAAVCCAAAALAGCGLTNSPADNLTFSPPSGWQASPGILGFMQFWKPPHADDEVLMLFKSPKPIDPHAAFEDAKLNDAAVQSRQTIHICGNQPAEYVTARGTSASVNLGNATAQKRNDMVQIVIFTNSAASYMSMYAYPEGRSPDPQAVAALRELCAK